MGHGSRRRGTEMGSPVAETLTIHEILSHPRYREFARDCTERGRQVEPDHFPWLLMGASDEEILAMDLRFESGQRMREQDKRNMVIVVRAQERLVCDWWRWWGGWEWIAKSRRPTEHVDDDYAVAQAARADRRLRHHPQPGFLF